jgi:DNA-binding transcriptional MerR regulator
VTVRLDIGVKVKRRMLIGELAARTGASHRSLRYYEQQGLLAATRTENGYRAYDDAAVEAVARIRALLAAGLGVDAIRTVLPCTLDAAPTVGACDAVVSTLRTRLDRLTADLAATTEAHVRVTELLSTARPGPPTSG